MPQAAVQSAIAVLLTNNDEPPKVVVHEVQTLLLEPMQELGIIDRQIQQLEKNLKELKARRSKVKETVSRYRTILSPIRRIPPDVLQEIFFCCLDDLRNPAMLETEAPILLTRICSTWRSVALSSPRLWSRIHIVFTNQDLLPEINDESNNHSHSIFNTIRNPKAKIIQILRLRCEAVKEWLRRSGDCPLSISINYTANRTFHGHDRQNSEISQQLFKYLTSVSNRWQNIALEMPKDIYSKLAETFNSSQFNRLSTLQISFSQGDEWQWDPDLPKVLDTELTDTGILQAPNLKRLWTNAVPKTKDGWANLTCIYFRTPVSLGHLVGILTNSAALMHLKVTLVPEKTPGPAWDYLSVEIPSIIHLPRLRTLHISDDFPSYTNDFYYAIDAPGIISISFFTTRPHDHASVVPIAVLIRKSTQLKTLKLHADRYSNSQISEILLGASGVSNFTYDNSDTVPWGHARTISTEWNFADIFIAHSYKERAGSNVNGQDIGAPILPQLETLRLCNSTYTTRIAGLSEDNLLRFIVNRMDSSPLSAISSKPTLRHVDVTFNNPRQMDMKSHVEAHGISDKFTFNVVYPIPANHCSLDTYARSGLHKFDRLCSNCAHADEISTQTGSYNPLSF